MDRYQRVKVLGRGSYGAAILVRERKGGVQPLRVVKEIDLSRMPASAQREAESEASVLRSLSHPYIVAYFETFREATRLYIVMEYADNGDLSGAVKQRKAQGHHFSEADALKTLVQCSLALQHVHNKHILHRDLKSQNIFLTKSGDCKLGDFGIAKVLDHTQAEAVTLIGTPIYLAPEVCDNRPYGIKADIWSLGIVLYEVLALAPPFRAENLAALMMKILRADPDPLSADLYCEELRSLVGWMLQKTPEKRPTIDEVLAVSPVKSCAARLPAKAETKSGSGVSVAAAGAAGSAGFREGSLGRRPRSSASDRGEKAQSTASSSRASHMHAQAESVGAADSLDDFVASWKKPEQLRAAVSGRPGVAPQPVGGARQRAPSAGDAAAEFRRNRELAAAAKARAEGDLRGRPRCNSLDPAMGMSAASAASAASVASGASYACRDSRDARRLAEEQHLQALQEAAAQSRRDRRQVQQRMQDLDRPAERDDTMVFRSSDCGSARGESPAAAARQARGDAAACRRSAEDQRRQELQEAAVQARRDRELIRKKMQDLERAPPEHDATQRAFTHDVDVADESPHRGAAARQVAEEQHVQALQEAAAQARRDRQRIRQKMQELENPRDDHAYRDVEMHSSRGDSVERAPGSRAAARQAAEEQRVQALQEAAAQARRDRRQIQQKMQDLERVSSGEMQSCVIEDAAGRESGSARRPGSGRLNRSGDGGGARSWAASPSPSRAEKEKAEALHVQALQEAAANARRERRLLQQRMAEAAQEEASSAAIDTGSGICNSRKSSAQRSSPPPASPERASPTPAAANASWSQRHSLADLLAAENQPDAVGSAQRSSPPPASPHRASPLPAAANASWSQRHSLADLLAAENQPSDVGVQRSSPPLPSAPRTSTPPVAPNASLSQRHSLSGLLAAENQPTDPAGLQRASPPPTTPPTPPRANPLPASGTSWTSRHSLADLLAAENQPADSRARSAEVRLDSTQRRPLGRSSSLSLAGSLMARSGSGFGRPSTADADGPTSAPSGGSLELQDEAPLSPQFGSRSASLEGAARACVSSAAAAAEETELRASSPAAARSRSRTRSGSGERGQERKPDFSMCSTLRLTQEPNTPAEELLAMKLSRLRSPPPRLTRSGGTADRSVENLQSASQAAHVNTSRSGSGNLTLESIGSLSYTGTGTISSRISTVSCITAQ